MARTSPVINFGAVDAVGLKLDSTPTCSVSLQSFCKIADLKLHAAANAYPYADYEPDYWLLDGSFKFKPIDETNVHYGIVTTVQSNSAGVFASAPILTVTFGSNFATDGLTLYFDDRTGDYCNSLIIAYYDNSNALIRSDAYNPTGVLFSANQSVANVKKIIITFNSTNRPYRYLRLLDIDYAITTYFTGDEIKSANLIEEICPTALELPFSSIDFKLFTSNPQFSIIAPVGGYTLLQYRQPLYVYEQVDAAMILIGKFYLENWENITEKVVSLHAIDAVGVLDKVQYLGHWLTGMTAFDFLYNILISPMGLDFTIDGSLSGITLNGVLPIATRRETLQNMAISIGAYVTCARDGRIQVLPMQLASSVVTPDATITSAEKGINQSLKLKQLVTGIELTSHDWASNGLAALVYSATLTPGDYRITFDKPINNSTVVVTGATGTTLDVNWIIIHVTAPGTVTVTADGLVDSQVNFTVNNLSLPAGTQTNIVKITDTVLVTQAIAQVTTQRIYDYYQERYLQRVRMFAPTVKVGNSVLVDSLSGHQIIGIIERMETDLAGGFTSNVDIVGIVKP